jgi:NhaP-type Na+/H+ or K+/H+ antiporter
LGANDVARMPEIVKRWEAARELSHQEQSVWDRGWILAAIFVLLGAEWWLRRREGLL